MKLNKILNIVFAIAFFAALVGAIELFYNSVELFVYYVYNKRFYTGFQVPIAVFLLVASLLSLSAVGAAVAYFIVKQPKHKVRLIIVAIVAVVFIFIAMVVTIILWHVYINYMEGPPFDVDSYILTAFTTYLSLMSVIVQNLICFAVLATLLVIEFKTEKRAKAEGKENVEIAKSDKELVEINNEKGIDKTEEI